MAVPQQIPHPLTILVVDDDADTAVSLAELLSLHGHAVEVAFDGSEALEQVARCAPVVVLLDIWMPGMDGFEVARAIRARCPADATRPFLIAVTGYEGPPGSPERALFDLYCIKPVDPAVLVGVLARIRRCLAPSVPPAREAPAEEPPGPIVGATEVPRAEGEPSPAPSAPMIPVLVAVA